MAKHGATRHKRGARGARGARGVTHKKRATFHPNVGTVFPYANTAPTGRDWHNWRHATTVLEPDHFREIVPKGSRSAITASWINGGNLPYYRGRLHRNYPEERPRTRSMTRYPRLAAQQATVRAAILQSHLNALAEGRNNGQGGAVTESLGDNEQVLVNLIVKKILEPDSLSPEEQAELERLYLQKHGIPYSQNI